MLFHQSEIRRRLKQLESRNEIRILREEENGIQIYDLADCCLEVFRFPEKLNRKTIPHIFDFGSVQINKERFFRIIDQHVDKYLFMNVLNIYFLNNERDYQNVLKQYPDLTYSYHDYYGWRERTKKGTIVLVNVDTIYQHLHRVRHYPNTTEKEKFNLFVWEVLIHELRHAMTNNLIISEEELPLSEDEEEAIIRYAREVVQERIIKDEYVCI